MKHLTVVLFLVVLSGLLAFLPAAAQDDSVLDANLTDECVTDYDPEVDYFPNKVEITYAENFSVAYVNHYKVVTVADAFDGAGDDVAGLEEDGLPEERAATFGVEVEN